MGGTVAVDIGDAKMTALAATTRATFRPSGETPIRGLAAPP